MRRKDTGSLPEICRRIISVRRERGWTQELLAEKCGITGSCLHMKELGKRSFRVEEVCRIADAFDMTMEELVRGVKPQHVVTHRDLGLSDACCEALKDFHTANPEGAKGLSKALSSMEVLDLLSQYMAYPSAEENSGENRSVGMKGVSDDQRQIRCVVSHAFFGKCLLAALLSALKDLKEK